MHQNTDLLKRLSLNDSVLCNVTFCLKMTNYIIVLGFCALSYLRAIKCFLCEKESVSLTESPKYYKFVYMIPAFSLHTKCLNLNILVFLSLMLCSTPVAFIKKYLFLVCGRFCRIEHVMCLNLWSWTAENQRLKWCQKALTGFRITNICSANNLYCVSTGQCAEPFLCCCNFFYLFYTGTELKGVECCWDSCCRLPPSMLGLVCIAASDFISSYVLSMVQSCKRICVYVAVSASSRTTHAFILIENRPYLFTLVWKFFRSLNLFFQVSMKLSTLFK